ncbi:MAG: FIST C-terminal domain-containing protein, partial [Nitrospinaceae bacterium]|nr:FIST C-terminal domain-containing protein [Nitrospinaceae bacterium]
DSLVSGAEEAAKNCITQKNENPELAILISCIGRKIVMRQRVEEEIEIVRDVFSPETTLTGFYSYGEIAPTHNSNFHHLHNQTMSITTISES